MSVATEVSRIQTDRNTIRNALIEWGQAQSTDNLDTLATSHDKFKEFSLEKGASVTAVPYHPGAAKYFAEHNRSCPDHPLEAPKGVCYLLAVRKNT